MLIFLKIPPDPLINANRENLPDDDEFFSTITYRYFQLCAGSPLESFADICGDYNAPELVELPGRSFLISHFLLPPLLIGHDEAICKDGSIKPILKAPKRKTRIRVDTLTRAEIGVNLPVRLQKIIQMMYNMLAHGSARVLSLNRCPPLPVAGVPALAAAMRLPFYGAFKANIALIG